MPKLRPIQVEITVQDIRKSMKQWSDMSKEKFNDYLSIPDCVIERCATSVYHQLKHRNNMNDKYSNDLQIEELYSLGYTDMNDDIYLLDWKPYHDRVEFYKSNRGCYNDVIHLKEMLQILRNTIEGEGVSFDEYVKFTLAKDLTDISEIFILKVTKEVRISYDTVGEIYSYETR